MELDMANGMACTVGVPDGKKKFLQQRVWQDMLSALMFERAMTVAYNCGEGSMNKEHRVWMPMVLLFQMIIPGKCFATAVFIITLGIF